ncbi:hypothetical protein [Legionella bononiensis]|uniref:Ankyrin repeats (3 copies) n=1 Tax=Legionella bononiensis TaxID=2793102 RepID=A0ABS1WED6_9GAMM|nr:hypothetical protein [Legionella bononiensis]MBL7479425.1 hypothetical protein [Legionella bononiensis]MBL7527702.1 hypothetical protein [Legionella bononiensis]MBL7563615.1 hypothetical protein [Legionella bononiensis]
MKIIDILINIATIKQEIQRRNNSELSVASSKRKLTRKAHALPRTPYELIQIIEQENGNEAAKYVRQIFAESESIESGFAQSASSSSAESSASSSSDPALSDDTHSLYQKLLPLCQLAYIEERNGNPEEHASKLALIFDSEQDVLNYLTEFPKGNPVNYLVHDACLFGLPQVDRCDFTQWKKLAVTQSNMLNPRFRELLPHAEAIERVNSLATKKRKWDKPLIAKENELKQLLRLLKKEKSTEKLKELNQKKSSLYLELAELAKGIPLRQASFLMLRSFYEYYKIHSDPEHQILVEHGLDEQSITLFYRLQRTNDDDAIPAITIRGSDIGYSGVYLTKLNVLDDKGAALAACLGKLTQCCQFLGGAGEIAVRHGIESPNGGFYVLFQGDENNPSLDDRILAQTWVWRSTEGNLCFDSVEVAPNQNLDWVPNMYRYLAMSLCYDKRIQRVNIGEFSGLSYGTGFENSHWPIRAPRVSPIDHQRYSDANSQLALADTALPFLYRKHGDLEALKLMEQTKVRSYYRQILELPDTPNNNRILKQVIGDVLHHFGNADELLELLRDIPGDRAEQVRELINVNSKYQHFLFFMLSDSKHDSIREIEYWFNQGASILTSAPGGTNILYIAKNNPLLLKAIFNLLPEEERIYAIQNSDRHSTENILFEINNPVSLNIMFRLIPKKHRLNMMLLANKGANTVLRLHSNDHNLPIELLSLLPKRQRLKAIQDQDYEGNSLLHDFINEEPYLKTVKRIMDLLPVDQRLEAVRTINSRRETVLLMASKNPQCLLTLLECIPEEQRFMALCTLNLDGSTLFQQYCVQVLKEKKLHHFDTILAMIPLEQRSKFCMLHRSSITMLHKAASDPQILKIILEWIPESERYTLITKKNSDSKSPLSEAMKSTKSMEVIYDLVPAVRDMLARQIPVTGLASSPHSIFSGGASSLTEPTLVEEKQVQTVVVNLR